MSDKSATVINACPLELTDCTLCYVDCCQRVLPVVIGLGRIVSLMPLILQSNEFFRKFLDFMRKSLHRLLVQAGIFCIAVFKCAIYLMPSRGAFSADKQIGGSVGQRVEHSIIRSADRAVQVGLSGRSRLKIRQVAGSRYQVSRVQVSRHLYIGW